MRLSQIGRKLAVGAAGVALAVGAVLAAAAPASATGSGQGVRAPGFTTPYWGMSCNTGTGGSFGNYYGWASCSGTGVWRVRTSCTAGFTYTSPKVIQVESTQIASAGACYWGVSSVQVLEYSS